MRSPRRYSEYSSEGEAHPTYVSTLLPSSSHMESSLFSSFSARPPSNCVASSSSVVCRGTRPTTACAITLKSTARSSRPPSCATASRVARVASASSSSNPRTLRSRSPRPHTLSMAVRCVRACVKLCVLSSERFDLILPTCVVSRVVLGPDRSRPSERSPAKPSRCEASEPRRSLWAA